MTETLQDAITEHLTRAQQHWRSMMDHENDEDSRHASILGHIHEITAASLLIDFAAAAPDAAATAQRELAEMLEAAGSTGPWLWEQLVAHGIDPATIKAFPPLPARTAAPAPATTGGEPHA